MSLVAAPKGSRPRKRNAARKLEPETITAVSDRVEPGTITATPAQPESETIMPDRNARIREIAYLLWLEEGSPEGQQERHWLAAETLLESDPVERKRIEGEPPGEPV